MKFINLKWIPLAILFILLTYMIWQSLSWPMTHDTNTFLYATKMFFKNGTLPYLNIHEENPPLTYFLYYSIGLFFSPSDWGFRLFDFLFCFTLLTSWFVFSRKNRTNVFWGVFLYIFIYYCLALKEGLQREHLLLLPLSFYLFSLYYFRRSLLSSFILGLSFSFLVFSKPTLVALAIPAGICLWNLKPNYKQWALLLAGALIPLFITFLFLFSFNLTQSFYDLAVGYWPLYGKFQFELNSYYSSGLAVFMKRHMFFPNLGRTYSALPLFFLLLFLFFIFKRQKIKMETWDKALVLHVVFFLLYPSFNKLYLPHYYIPFWFLSLVLIFTFLEKIQKTKLKFFSYLYLFLFSLFTFYTQAQKEIAISIERVILGSSRAQIEILEEKGFNPLTDKIQPIGWAGGTSLLTLNGLVAQMPTRFIYAQHFFVSPESSYVRKIRQEFMDGLEREKPRFILMDPIQTFFYGDPLKLHPDELNFPEFFNFLQTNYILLQSQYSDEATLPETSLWKVNTVWMHK